MRNQTKENDNGRHRPAHKNEKQNEKQNDKTVNEKDKKDKKDRKTEKTERQRRNQGAFGPFRLKMEMNISGWQRVVRQCILNMPLIHAVC